MRFGIQKSVLLFWIFLLVSSILYGQRYHLPLKSRLAMPTPYFIQESEKMDSLFSIRTPDNISNPCISQISFSQALTVFELYTCNRIGKAKFESFGFDQGEYSSSNHRWKLLGLRGAIKGKEVLILDENFDYDLTNDSVYYLPKPALNDNVPLYHRVYYETDFRIERNISYEFLHNDIVHKLGEPVGFTVTVVYDSLAKNLTYSDLFKLGYREKLVFDDVLDGEKVNIQVLSSTSFPSLYPNFKIITSASTCRKSLKEPFTVGASNFIIDSFDLIHKSLYVSNYRTPYDWGSIKGSSVTTGDVLTFDQKAKVKLIHVWSTWCRPCIKNLPKLKELSQHLPSVSVLGICIGENKTKAQEHITKNNLDWPLMYFDSKPDFVKNEMALDAYPCYIVLDANNTILYKGSDLDQAKNQLEILTMKK